MLHTQRLMDHIKAEKSPFGSPDEAKESAEAHAGEQWLVCMRARMRMCAYAYVCVCTYAYVCVCACACVCAECSWLGVVFSADLDRACFKKEEATRDMGL
jgi:hypothetical protein